MNDLVHLSNTYVTAEGEPPYHTEHEDVRIKVEIKPLDWKHLKLQSGHITQPWYDRLQHLRHYDHGPFA